MSPIPFGQLAVESYYAGRHELTYINNEVHVNILTDGRMLASARTDVKGSGK